MPDSFPGGPEERAALRSRGVPSTRPRRFSAGLPTPRHPRREPPRAAPAPPRGARRSADVAPGTASATPRPAAPPQPPPPVQSQRRRPPTSRHAPWTTARSTSRARRRSREETGDPADSPCPGRCPRSPNPGPPAADSPTRIQREARRKQADSSPAWRPPWAAADLCAGADGGVPSWRYATTTRGLRKIPGRSTLEVGGAARQSIPVVAVVVRQGALIGVLS